MLGYRRKAASTGTQCGTSCGLEMVDPWACLGPALATVAQAGHSQQLTRVAAGWRRRAGSHRAEEAGRAASSSLQAGGRQTGAGWAALPQWQESAMPSLNGRQQPRCPFLACRFSTYGREGLQQQRLGSTATGRGLESSLPCCAVLLQGWTCALCSCAGRPLFAHKHPLAHRKLDQEGALHCAAALQHPERALFRAHVQASVGTRRGGGEEAAA